MSGNKLPVTVIVVSFNTKDRTRKALKALYKSSQLPEEVILVDNDSKDGSVEMVKKEFLEVKIIENKENVGFAKANNQAIKQTASKYVWLLNSDTETGEKSLEQLYEYMEKNAAVGAVGPLLVYPSGELQSPGGYFPSFMNVLGYLLPFGFFLPSGLKVKMRRISLFPRTLPKEGLELDYVTGAASMLRRTALDESGLLGEEYFMYFEETDLAWRMKKNGWKIIAIGTEPVVHVYGGSFKTRSDPRRLKMFLESLQVFIKKNYSPARVFSIKMLILLFGRVSIFFKTRRTI